MHKCISEQDFLTSLDNRTEEKLIRYNELNCVSVLKKPVGTKNTMALSTPNNTSNEAALLEHFALPGRKTELRQFLKTLTLCRSGQGKAVFLTGNEGIGKSLLLETFLQLAESGCDCKTLSISIPSHLTPYRLFSLTVQELLILANSVVENSLNDINQVLQKLGLRWTKNDLSQMVSLLHLQESFEGHRVSNEKDLSRSIYSALPVFKRLNSSVKEQIKELNHIFYNPWLTLAVSLLNPLNPQMRSALSLIENTSFSADTNCLNLLPAAIQEQICLSDPISNDSDVKEPERLSDNKQNGDNLEVPLPSLNDLQNRLVELLTFINNALRQGQSALVISFDHWESILCQPENIRNDVKNFMGDVIKKTVEQRDFRMMFVISCRSEAESYAVGGNLFNALRVKSLVPSLGFSVQQRVLKDRFKEIGISCEDNVLQEIIKICQGNPAWLRIFSRVIESDIRQSGIKSLDWNTYQERFAINKAEDLLELLYARMQLSFVGEETLFLKALGRMVSLFSRKSFKRSQAVMVLPDIEDNRILMERLLDALEQHGFIDRVNASGDEDITYRFYGSFLLTYLGQKGYPLQEDIPASDKIASLKKILPLSIQAGDLTQEKTQELLAMAAALDNTELVEFVELTLIDALNEPEIPSSTKAAIIESLGLIRTPESIQAIIKNLSSSEALLREKACSQLISCAKTPEGPFCSRMLLPSVLPLCEDISLSVRSEAYRFISVCSDNNDQIIHYLLKGLESPDADIRKFSLRGVLERKMNSQELLKILKNCMEQETEIELFRLILETFRNFESEKAVSIFVSYLKTHEKNNFWVETMTMLLNSDINKAIPWVSSLLNDSMDIDLQLSLVRLLGSYRIPEVEVILVDFLNKQPESLFLQAPELRWMTIRSLGWVGSSKESIKALEEQVMLCQKDEILLQSVKTAIKQISKRMGNRSFSSNSHLVKPEQNLYVPRNITSNSNESSLITSSKTDEPDIENSLIDLVPASMVEE